MLIEDRGSLKKQCLQTHQGYAELLGLAACCELDESNAWSCSSFLHSCFQNVCNFFFSSQIFSFLKKEKMSGNFHKHKETIPLGSAIPTKKLLAVLHRALPSGTQQIMRQSSCAVQVSELAVLGPVEISG